MNIKQIFSPSLHGRAGVGLFSGRAGVGLFMLFLCMTAQMAQAQEKPLDFPLHMKCNGMDLTMDCPLQQVLDAILVDDKEAYMLFPGTTLDEGKRREDAFGNWHVTYNQKMEEGESHYQLILHYRSNGSLYYANGNIAVAKGASPAKGSRSARRKSPEQASVIATGSSVSKVEVMLVSHKGVPHEAYKVLDSKTLHNVYVDVYSGDILFTEPLVHSFAPWSQLNGTPVTLIGKTSFNGLQNIDLMQTDKGYILRDPKRNIVTIDSSNRLNGLDWQKYPKDMDTQFRFSMDMSDDFVFTDKEQLLEGKYTAAITDFKLCWTSTKKEMPKELHLHAYYKDNDGNPLDDILNVDQNDLEWKFDETDEEGDIWYVCSYKLPQPISVNLFDRQNMVEVITEHGLCTKENGIMASDKIDRYMDGDSQDYILTCNFTTITEATQAAIDVHWAMQKIHDMYREYFDINGCDNKGCQIVNFVNPGNDLYVHGGLPNNATAGGMEIIDSYGMPTYVMSFGVGEPGIATPLTSLDIAGHEFTHNVTAGSGNSLFYMNESGALNEATADCMSMVVEHYVTGQPSWMYSGMVYMMWDNMRSFANPWLSSAIGDKTGIFPQPKYYGGRYWIDYNTEDYDYGGVHFNSGVFNHLFYLLCEGAVGATNEYNETRDINAIGIDRMKDILFHSMMYYNSTLCNYAEIADNLLVTVEDIFEGNADVLELQADMLTAYDHVGMTSTICPTGIKSISLHQENQGGTSYNIYGVPVNDNYRGVVIRGGKKYVK